MTDDSTVDRLVDDFEEGDVLEDLFRTLEESREAREREVRGEIDGEPLEFATEEMLSIDATSDWPDSYDVSWSELLHDADHAEYSRAAFEVRKEKHRAHKGFSTDSGRPPEPDVYESFSTPIDPRRAYQILDRLWTLVDAREREGYEIDHVVIGMPQYRVLEPWAQSEYGESITSMLPVPQVTVVQGPMMYPVIPPRHLFHEYLEERER